MTSRFNEDSTGRAMDLHNRLTDLVKLDSQSMQEYLREINQIFDSLATIWSPVFNVELINCTNWGLDKEYYPIIAAVTYMGDLRTHTFDDFRTKLIVYEQRLLHLRRRDNEGV